MPFVKGQSGNPGGRRKNAVELKALLDRVLSEVTDPATARTRAENVVRKVVEAAEGGAEWAIKEVWDRADGKAKQSMDIDARATVLVQNLIK